MLDDILIEIIGWGGRPFIVGGWVRDQAMGMDSKDIDIEVFDMSIENLEKVLSTFGQVDKVGVSFGVLKLHGLDVDFSVPRRDSKVGVGHKGFHVETDPNMTVEEAASRRDFTMNAMAWDVTTKTITDPFGGQEDIAAGVLRHTSEQFSEDPLRVLRGMQFAARFTLDLHWTTALAMSGLIREFDTLATERVWGEWCKWAAKGKTPSKGLEVLHHSGWVRNFPELMALIDTPQQPEWHPEGSVWDHTCHAVDAAARIADRNNLSSDERLVLVMAALCHDMGKPEVTARDDSGNIISQGHSQAGVDVAARFMARIGAPAWVTARVGALVAEHMAHVGVTVTPRMVRRLARRLAPSNVEEWAMLVEADHSARPPLPPELPWQAVQVVREARRLDVNNDRPAPVLMGRHLLPHMRPGPDMGRVLAAAFEAQLDGVFETPEDGVTWAQNNGWF